MEKKLKKLLKQLRINEDTISMILGSVVLVIVGVLVYNYFTSLNKGGQIASGATKEAVAIPGKVEIQQEGDKKFAKGLPTTYQVQKGDHLWKIAENFYTSGYNWIDIAKENGIKNPNQIEVGQQLVIPKVELKVTTLNDKQTIPQSIEGTSYTTTAGDYLWNIAVRTYGDGYAWTKIYQANKEAIGSNPNRVEKGITLIIPR